MELAWWEEFSLPGAMGKANKYNHLHLILPQVANLKSISLKTLSRTRYLIVLQQVNSIHISRIPSVKETAVIIEPTLTSSLHLNRDF